MTTPKPMTFTYVGPSDEVEVLVRVRRGDTIVVPAAAAGASAAEEVDDDGEVVFRDVGSGLLSQIHAWAPDKSTLSALTVPMLTLRARELDVEVPAGALKADIVAAILANTPEV